MLRRYINSFSSCWSLCDGLSNSFSYLRQRCRPIWMLIHLSSSEWQEIHCFFLFLINQFVIAHRTIYDVLRVRTDARHMLFPHKIPVLILKYPEALENINCYWLTHKNICHLFFSLGLYTYRSSFSGWYSDVSNRFWSTYVRMFYCYFCRLDVFQRLDDINTSYHTRYTRIVCYDCSLTHCQFHSILIDMLRMWCASHSIHLLRM